MNFEAVVGLEIHVAMNTKSKMFSSAPVSFGATPNTNVAPLDICFPGTLPLVNKQVVINAIKVCNALHMTIDDELWFDRKNYFYSDLAKGYQITQQRRPIGRDGYLDIDVDGKTKRIGIERLHMEEDACKQLHIGDSTLLDYNRSGVPLLEIVFLPDVSSGHEAMKCVEKIRSIVSFLEVSSGKMEEGSLRCDINVSIRPIGSKKLGSRVEIKNVNTLANIQRAIDFEIKRQEALLLSGQKVKLETLRFDELKKETIKMRVKNEAIDYKYFTDPNIVPIKLSKEFIEDAIKSSPELAEAKYERYLSIGLNEYDSNLLSSNKEISDYFDEVIRNGASPKLAANWIIVDVQAVLNKRGIDIKQFPICAINLNELIQSIEKKKISNKQARIIFDKMQYSDMDPHQLIKEMNITLIADEVSLMNIVNQVLDENPQTVSDYKNGKDRVVGYLVGQVMKKSGGEVDPALTNKLVVKGLKER